MPLTKDFVRAAAAHQWRLAYALLDKGSRARSHGGGQAAAAAAWESGGVVSSLAGAAPVAPSAEHEVGTLRSQAAPASAPDAVDALLPPPSSTSLPIDARTVSSRAWRDANPPLNEAEPSWINDSFAVIHYRMW